MSSLDLVLIIRWKVSPYLLVCYLIVYVVGTSGLWYWCLCSRAPPQLAGYCRLVEGVLLTQLR